MVKEEKMGLHLGPCGDVRKNKSDGKMGETMSGDSKETEDKREKLRLHPKGRGFCSCFPLAGMDF